MPLDDMIKKLGMEDENEAMEVVASALTYLPVHDSFPKYALLMGFDWYMLAQVDFYTPPYSSDEQYPEWYKVKTNLEVVGFIQDEYHLITDILKRLEKKIQNEELALLLFSEARSLEADGLWPDRKEFEGWYTAHHDGKKLSVFPYARETFEANPIAASATRLG